jgi:poly(A) polymerase
VQQKIYPKEVHSLDHNRVDEHALYVMEKLRQAGFTAYLVGGSVRDLLLNRQPKDFDISTSAQPEEIKRLFKNCILIGKRFRLAHIRFGKKVLEVSTFRAGDNETDALIVRDNIWGTPEEDVIRRDFTINGLFYDPASQTVIDYVEGYPDIANKYLRTIGQPFVRFRQDPVRMIRCLKFQARFGFEVDPQVHIALLESRHEILKSSSARILEELLRMLESGASSPFFQLMIEHGLLQLMLPALASFLEKTEGAEIYAYLQEIDAARQEPRASPLERPVLLSCLLYPLLQKRLQERYLDRGQTPHLGEIQNDTHDLITEVFLPFFHIPRRLRCNLCTVLTSQYRMTPMEKRKQRRPRIPNDPDFSLALTFLKVRCRLEPGLQTVWEEWSQAIPSTPEAPRKRRKRRRRRQREE